MNERIKELLSKAQEQARAEVEQDPKFKPPYLIPATEVHVGLGLSYEKFAELIVKECAGIVNSLEQYEGQGDCSTAEYIKEHFGVEE